MPSLILSLISGVLAVGVICSLKGFEALVCELCIILQWFTIE